MAEPATSPNPFDALGPARPRDRVLRLLAAIGYASRGALWLVVGVLALLSVWGPREPEGPHDALTEIVRAPFGRSLEAILGTGLLAYAAWRFLQAVPDKDRRGRALTPLLVRLGFLVSCGTYLTTALYAYTLAAGVAKGEDGAFADWSRPFFATSAGRAFVAIMGISAVSMAIAQLTIAWSESYKRRFTASWHDAAWARLVARVGLGAKSVVFGILGALLVWAAVTEDHARPRGFGGALVAIHGGPFGDAVLTAVAAGLLAYGAYSFLMARYRDARW